MSPKLPTSLLFRAGPPVLLSFSRLQLDPQLRYDPVLSTATRLLHHARRNAWFSVAAVAAFSACDSKDLESRREAQKAANVKQAVERKAVEAKGEEYRAKGADFSVPVPEGYTQVVDGQVLAAAGPGGFAFTAKKRAGPDWFIASIAFAHAGDAAAEVADAAGCKKTAAGLAGATNTTLQRAGMVKVGEDDRCQWALVDNEDKNRGAIGTAMLSPSSVWVVTCNHDLRDKPATHVCTDVLTGWKNDKRAAPRKSTDKTAVAICSAYNEVVAEGTAKEIILQSAALRATQKFGLTEAQLGQFGARPADLLASLRKRGAPPPCAALIGALEAMAATAKPSTANGG